MQRRGTATLLAPLSDDRARPLLLSFWAAELSDGMISAIVPIAVYLITQDVGVLALVFALLGTGLGALGAFDNPAAEAAIRSVFRHDLQAIAAMRKVAKTLSDMIGPAAGGLLIGLTGPTGALWASICLITVALVVLALAPRLPGRTRGAVAPPPVPGAVAHPAQRPQGTARPRLLVTIYVAGFGTSFLVGLVIAAGVPHLADHPQAPEGAYGYALAVYSVGAMVGAWVAGLIPWRDEQLRTVLVISAFGYGLIAAGGMVGPWWTMLISWLVWGICFGPDDILTDRYLVARAPDHRLARRYATWTNVHRLGALAAYLMMYVGGQQDPTRLTVWVSLGFAVLAPAVVLLLGRRAGRARGRFA